MDHSLIIDEHLTRQIDLISRESLNSNPVTVIGCGAIGSFAALALAKMGLTRMTLYDMDKVDIVNMNAQFFPYQSIGSNKARATAHLLKEFANCEVIAHERAFTRDDVMHLSHIVVVAVDSMEVRGMVFDEIKKSGFNVKLIIDPRMSAESYAQYAINPFDTRDCATYDKTLYTDGESVQERCTAKSTIYTAMLSAGYIAKTAKQFISGQKYTRCLQWDIRLNVRQMTEQESQG